MAITHGRAGFHDSEGESADAGFGASVGRLGMRKCHVELLAPSAGQASDGTELSITDSWFPEKIICLYLISISLSVYLIIYLIIYLSTYLPIYLSGCACVCVFKI